MGRRKCWTDKRDTIYGRGVRGEKKGEGSDSLE